MHWWCLPSFTVVYKRSSNHHVHNYRVFFFSFSFLSIAVSMPFVSHLSAESSASQAQSPFDSRTSTLHAHTDSIVQRPSDEKSTMKDNAKALEAGIADEESEHDEDVQEQTSKEDDDLEEAKTRESSKFRRVFTFGSHTKPKYDSSLFLAIHRTFFSRIWIGGFFKLFSGPS